MLRETVVRDSGRRRRNHLAPLLYSSLYSMSWAQYMYSTADREHPMYCKLAARACDVWLGPRRHVTLRLLNLTEMEDNLALERRVT